MSHTVTVNTTARQLGRTRVVDHHWTCSCGEHSTAPTGFRFEHEALTNSLHHRR